MKRQDINNIVHDYSVQTDILKIHNSEVSEFKKVIRELEGFRDTLHKAHNGYTDPNIETPESSDEALLAVVREARGMIEQDLHTSLSQLSIAIGLLRNWRSVTALSNEQRNELASGTTEFLETNVIADAHRQLKEANKTIRKPDAPFEHVHGPGCEH